MPVRVTDVGLTVRKDVAAALREAFGRPCGTPRHLIWYAERERGVVSIHVRSEPPRVIIHMVAAAIPREWRIVLPEWEKPDGLAELIDAVVREGGLGGPYVVRGARG